MLRAGDGRVGLVGIERRFVEDPLNGGVEEREKRFVRNGPIEPKMDASDGRDLDFIE